MALDPLALAALTLAHVLVFVYWLGGDLGAFYASTILTDAKQPTPARAAAAKVLANIDMAPRTALILAFPTGYTLAAAKYGAPWSPALLTAMWVGFLAWLALAWRIHLRHDPPKAPTRQADLWIRWVALAALAALALGLAPLSQGWPLFLKLKAGILAAAIGCGLLIRVMLAPFGPLFARLMSEGPSDDVNAGLAGALNRSRPIVLALWALLLAAALLGLWTPV